MPLWSAQYPCLKISEQIIYKHWRSDVGGGRNAGGLAGANYIGVVSLCISVMLRQWGQGSSPAASAARAAVLP